MNNEKQPQGIQPKRMHQEIRFVEVSAAITRYMEAGYKVPSEWINEYNELIVNLSTTEE